jgi:hypothetical protein
MDPETWESTRDLDGMLRDLRALTLPERKFHLAAVAFCRQVWSRFPDEICRESIEAVEQVADGLIERKRLARFRKPLAELRDQYLRTNQVDRYHGAMAAYFASKFSATSLKDVAFSAGLIQTKQGLERAREAQLRILRDIFGNPFRPVKFNPDWRTSTAVALAQQMYESRDFGAMPILADALQDAGCDCDDVLTHCRDAKGIHVRGCWVVDLVLGKS